MQNLATLNKQYYAAKQKLDLDPENDFNYQEMHDVLFHFMDYSTESQNHNWFMRSYNELLRNRPITEDFRFYEKLAFKLGKYIWYLKPDDNTAIDENKLAPIWATLPEMPFNRGGKGFKFLLKALLRIEPNAAIAPELTEWILKKPITISGLDWYDVKRDGRTAFPAFTKTFTSSLKKILLEMDYSNDEDSLARRLEKYLIPILKEGIHNQLPRQEWFFYNYFLLQIKKWRGENIFEELCNTMLQKPYEFYMWNMLGDVAPEQYKTACYCAALDNGKDERMLVKVHHKLALQLVQNQEYDMASAEINCIVETRNNNDWDIPPELMELMEKHWYKPQTNIGKTERKAFYKKHAFEAYGLCGDPIKGVFTHYTQDTHRNKDVYYYHFATDLKRPHVLRSKEKLHFTVGEAYELITKSWFLPNRGKNETIYWVRPTTMPLKQLVKTETGKLLVPPTVQHGFLNDVFLTPAFIKKHKLENGQFIKLQAVKNWNRKRNQSGWIALRLLQDP